MCRGARRSANNGRHAPLTDSLNQGMPASTALLEKHVCIFYQVFHQFLIIRSSFFLSLSFVVIAAESAAA